ncbi:GGDEF and EAL domain-containing protein [Paenibacillus sp. YPG26]|uniref:sensor domain-containing protein n=1 Tax=Paenibacillus sp. YPG26 TaxID=2878915 RepID=UPI002040033C|nr:GGDEF and EAL domain-containing protein [Paenibacillus sp. YPG26]USB33950.1 EAL domain-containing protein [Paenibacillus sp. YPG26]
MKLINGMFKNKWVMILVFLIITGSLFDILLNSRNETVYMSLHIIILLVTLYGFFSILKEVSMTKEELTMNNRRLNNMFETLDAAIWYHDMKTDTVHVTPGIEKLYGYPRSSFYEDKTFWMQVIVPEDMDVIRDRLSRTAKGETVTSKYRIVRPDGEVRWLQDRGIPKMDEKGSLVDFTSVILDITDLMESEHRYQSLVEMSPDLIAVITRGRIDYINKAGSALIGESSPAELIGQPIERFFPDRVLDEINMKEEGEGSGPKRKTVEFKVNRVDGKSTHVELSASPILFEGRSAIQVIGSDISIRKESEKMVEFMAYYDALTELPNRYKLREHLNHILNQAKNEMLALLFLDLDRFKIINDTKGHMVGDLLLQKVAKRLEKAVQGEGLVSRQGGDEFIILLENCSKDEVTRTAKQLLIECSRPIEINRQEYFVTASIGISMYPADGADEETLIKHADTAMYLAKERGKNNYQFYSSDLNGLSTRKMELENGLRRAIEQDEMVIYYQPQVELTTGELVGIEALLRWRHPQYGMISPLEFIPLAEETGLIVPLGKWVMRTACMQNKAWQDQGHPAIPVAVNISVRQMGEENFVDSITEVLNETGLDPQYLELEITESMVQNIEKSTLILRLLRLIGVRISIDDFGTGYSSLSILKHLPIDKIKIDKSFIDDIIHHSNQGAMVKTIIDMGINLNFKVIAEGIEKKEQIDFLIHNACNLGQGYYYSPPLPVEKMEVYLRQGASGPDVH